ncbi:MAG: tRNA glutamyl-Q(34) synthetase GluQRS [Actinomycetia bacterium]|nr:tRNA glutamyl-Q(34) synthetase GluQRS [Actinomycetes bacterium]
MAVGRFAPSPSGRLHLGNLRTALLAWLFARSAGSAFLLRMEDLDVGRTREEHYTTQLDDLAALGLDWDGEVVRQSTRSALYDAAIDRLVAAGLTYPCWCTRREILEASSAPHGAPGAYAGTCRNLGELDRAEREAGGRSPALRLRTEQEVVEVEDRLLGRYAGVVDDLVLRRNDGTAAYNLAVVVDDADQGVEEVVRADDLLPSTPRQVLLARLLDLPVPAYAHVPLVLGPDGHRLAKRDGAVTLEDRIARGETPADVLRLLAASLGLAGDTPTELLAGFDPDRLPREPWALPAELLQG